VGERHNLKLSHELRVFGKAAKGANYWRWETFCIMRRNCAGKFSRLPLRRTFMHRFGSTIR
jgi:hypothetical protein